VGSEMCIRDRGRAKEIAQLAKARLADVPKDVASLRMTFHRGIYLAFIKS